MPGQRLLTNTEIADFLVRHPFIADWIISTKAAIVAGVYDWTQSALGLIPPWGLQQDDSSYGNVVVYFGPVDGQLYVSGWTDPIADINKAPYVSPPFKCKNGSDTVMGFCPEDFNFLYVIGFGLAAFVGYQMFFANKRV